MVSIRASRSAVVWLVLALTISACNGASSTDSSTTTTGVPQTTTGTAPRRRDDHPLDREYDLHERITDSTHGHRCRHNDGRTDNHINHNDYDNHRCGDNEHNRGYLHHRCRHNDGRTDNHINHNHRCANYNDDSAESG